MRPYLVLFASSCLLLAGSWAVVTIPRWWRAHRHLRISEVFGRRRTTQRINRASTKIKDARARELHGDLEECERIWELSE